MMRGWIRSWLGIPSQENHLAELAKILEEQQELLREHGNLMADQARISNRIIDRIERIEQENEVDENVEDWLDRER